MKRQKEHRKSLRKDEENAIISLQNQLAKALSDYKANFGEEDAFYKKARKVKADANFPLQKDAASAPPPSYDDVMGEDISERPIDCESSSHSKSQHSPQVASASKTQGSDLPPKSQHSPQVASAPQNQHKASDSKRRIMQPFSRDNPRETYREICARSWDALTRNQKQAARALGITKNMWNTDATWPVEGKNWETLTTKQQSAAYRLGYDKSSWDADEHYTDYAPYKQRFSY